MEVVRADELDGADVQLARMFLDGFGDYLNYFSKDRDRLVAAFAHMCASSSRWTTDVSLRWLPSPTETTVLSG